MLSSLCSAIFSWVSKVVIPVRYHNKFPKFVCNVIDLCTIYGQIIKIVWSFPLIWIQQGVKVNNLLFKVGDRQSPQGPKTKSVFTREQISKL